MEICKHVTHQAILCILFIVVFWADVNAQSQRSDETVSRRRVREDNIDFDVVKDTLEQLAKIKQDCTKLENKLIDYRKSLEQLEEDIVKINAAVTKQDKNTRTIQEKISSILHSQKEHEDVIGGFRNKLAGVELELVENKNVLDQKFMAPLEILNQTVQLLAHKPHETLSHQVAELKAELQEQMSLALQNALQEMSQLRENYTAEISMLKVEQKKQASEVSELFEYAKNMEETLLDLSQFRVNHTSKADLREKRAISNKCSLNIHHQPEGGRIDVLMVMDPPNIENAACN